MERLPADAYCQEIPSTDTMDGVRAWMKITVPPIGGRNAKPIYPPDLPPAEALELLLPIASDGALRFTGNGEPAADVELVRAGQDYVVMFRVHPVAARRLARRLLRWQGRTGRQGRVLYDFFVSSFIAARKAREVV